MNRFNDDDYLPGVSVAAAETINSMDQITDETDDKRASGDEWLHDLETLLNDPSCQYSQIRDTANCRPFVDKTTRAKAWMILLGIANRPDPFNDWDQLYDLKDQSRVRKDCEKIVARCGGSLDSSNRVALMSDLESVLTLYCKTRAIAYPAAEEADGWLDILQMLLLLDMPKTALFHAFFAFTTKYIPRGASSIVGKPFDLFRLLLLYHEPALCSFLDTRKIMPFQYAKQWFNSLFASIADLDIVLRLYDIYLQQADPFLVFFMALVMLINAKDAIVAMTDDTPETIAKMISAFPKQLNADDMDDFCQLADYYSKRTPQSFRRDYHGPLFGSNLADHFDNVTIHFLLCLPVRIQELTQSSHINNRDELVHYFVIDGRPMSQYSCGHLPNAFNLDCSMLVNSPAEFHLAVQSLGAFKAKTHPDDHICFIGSGDDHEDRYIHMVIASFLQKCQQHVSIAVGGYKVLHESVKDDLSTKLKSHNANGCAICLNSDGASRSPSDGDANTTTSSATSEKSSSMVQRIRNALFDRSNQVKERINEYIATSPTETSTNWHVDSSERHGVKYRNEPSVFSLGDESNSSGDEGESAFDNKSTTVERTKLKLSDFLKQAEVLAHFTGDHVDKGRRFLHPCHLTITRTHLHVFHDCPDQKGYVIAYLRRPLATIHKITSKKRMPELLSIRYGYDVTADQHKITGVDKFVLQKAGDCAKAIKLAIVALHEPAMVTPE